ncbi:MAG: hypothetical protein KF868_10585 [Acidobacteria bacterium]|nr:hypothetical protein [Acidobacteriota bacterium]
MCNLRKSTVPAVVTLLPVALPGKRGRTVASGVLCILLLAAQTTLGKKHLDIVVPRLDARVAPAGIAFAPAGELFIIHPDKQPHNATTGLWLRVFDVSTGREIRSNKLTIPARKVARGRCMLRVSANGRWLLYTNWPYTLSKDDPGFITIFDADTLNVISSLDEPGAIPAYARIFGFNSNSESVILDASAMQASERIGASVRIVQLNVRNLEEIVSDVTYANPQDGMLEGATPDGMPWFSRSTSVGYTLAPAEGDAGVRIEMTAEKGYGIGGVLFPDNAVVAISHDLTPKNDILINIYRLEPGQSRHLRNRTRSDCLVYDAILSPDKSAGAALCQASSTFELTFGRITARKAIVFDASSLRVLQTVGMWKRGHSLDAAVWHGNGRVRLATFDGPNRIKVRTIETQGNRTGPRN